MLAIQNIGPLNLDILIMLYLNTMEVDDAEGVE